MSELVEQVEQIERVSSGARVAGPQVERGREILTPEALGFLVGLHRRFAAQRRALLARRILHREEAVRRGGLDFRPETAEIRRSDWRVAPAPADLRDRRVEIASPTQRVATINALNSGARVWLADLEDSNTPHWENVIGGQVNLFDAVRRTITHTTVDGRTHTLRTDVESAAIIVRPRGWHLPEPHLMVDGEPMAACLVDFGLYLFHNAAELLARDSGPYFYLPKLEGGLEAKLWNDVFVHAQRELALPIGSIRATVLIETIPAVFEMDEILYELRQHVSGLATGRWDYLFSVLKTFRDAGPRFVLPDRGAAAPTTPFLRAYTDLLIRICHRRGAHAIGGIATQLPDGRDAYAVATASNAVRAEKRREAADGFDGSRVSHPGLVGLCREAFDEVLRVDPNQLDRTRDEATYDPQTLLDIASAGGVVTDVGLRAAVDLGIRYLIGWLGGSGAVPIGRRLVDTATAEISRSQLWQWVHNGVQLESGATVDVELVHEVVQETRERLQVELPAGQLPRLDEATEWFEEVALSERFIDFLTLPAVQRLP
ncbi:malate synthase A [Actinoalloteichus hymeniacidonis]|uniref:Malate synthase n=1 Tax=Actinoalloteichus hymeniacidonis TaxID=340345 RepID=A0AAC9N0U2_9PSEU|nr:malate synthase A [Actinoalloteichus hymeniacidonis]AOS65745.1 malate synthase A [Actinoalloteichus hymeniacidonis]MBB5906165.1 malate synthase [Actinoalloteichus hymeniacidonis]